MPLNVKKLKVMHIKIVFSQKECVYTMANPDRTRQRPESTKYERERGVNRAKSLSDRAHVGSASLTSKYEQKYSNSSNFFFVLLLNFIKALKDEGCCG